ncbi:MAG: GntR family transcriptional regulator [Bacillota bacterium]|nr:GntR family transcriptional regulator [Bacillota bacterium]
MPTPEMRVTDFAPLYHKVKEFLRQAITAGAYATGDLLPSETALCRQFGVSRITVRRALSDLAVEGLLQRKRGRGTFVARPKIERSLSGDPSFARDMIRMGYVPGAMNLKVSSGLADAHVLELLGLSEGDTVLVIDRVLEANGEPVAHQETIVPLRFLPSGFDPALFGQSPVFVVLEEAAGMVFTRVRTTIDPRTVSAEDASLLECGAHSPGFYVEQVIHTAAGTAVMNRGVVRGDRCRLVVETPLG